MELHNLKDEFRSVMGDLDINSPKFTDGEIEDWLNTAMIGLCVEYKLLWEITTISTDGTAYVSLPSNFLAPIHVFYNDEEIKLVSPADLSRRYAKWPTKTGTPERFFLKEDKLGLYPYTAAATDILSVHYIQSPTLMSAINDVPWDSVMRYEPLHPLIYLQAALRAALRITSQKKMSLIHAEISRVKEQTAWLIENPDAGHESTISREGYYPY